MEKTIEEYEEISGLCREVFEKKNRDYGTAWYILRTSSLTDQMYIKARRIRSIEEAGQQKVDEDVRSEYVGLVNYGVMAILQLRYSAEEIREMSEKILLKKHREVLEETKSLMQRKNHDYGEAWRNMRVSSLTDLILMKLLRVRQIEDNDGQTLVSEGLEANYMDIINYAIFALIHLQD